WPGLMECDLLLHSPFRPLSGRNQATLSSAKAFSTAVLTGLDTSSAALVATAWKSLACLTEASTCLRTKAVCSSTTSDSERAPTRASRCEKPASALARSAAMVLSDRSLETVLAVSKV